MPVVVSGQGPRVIATLRLAVSAFALSALAASALAACGDAAGSRATDSVTATSRARTAAPAPADTDDFGTALPTDDRDGARIVSLNPTVTEVLFAIGAGARLVGRTAWDEYPAEVKRIASLGDAIRPNVEAVLGVKPTLVVLYATAENRAAADAFRKAGVRVLALRVDSIAEFMALTDRLGTVTGERVRARAVRDSVQATLDRVRAATRGLSVRRVVWPAWLSPTMVIGGGSYLDELIEIAGGRNVFHDAAEPSPKVSVEEIARRDPELVVTSESTEQRLRTTAGWQGVRAVREGRFIRADPAVTGRPSVVLGMAAVALARAFHPEQLGSLR